MEAMFKRVFRGMLGLLFMALCIAAAWQAYQVQHELLAAIPDGVTVTEVRIDLEPGKSVVIGRRELGQRPGLSSSAESRHLRLAHVDDGWTIANIAARRRVLLDYTGYGKLYLRRWALRQGDELILGGRHFRVDRVDHESLVELSADGIVYQVHHRRGLSVELKTKDATGESSASWLDDRQCGIDQSGKEWIKQGLQALEFVSPKAERPMVSFGGGVDCSDRIAVPNLGPQSLRLVYRNGVIFFAPGKGMQQAVVFRRAGGKTWQSFADIDRPLFPAPTETLEGVPYGRLSSVIIGRTYYRVLRRDAGTKLVLVPYERLHRFFSLNTEARDPIGLRRLDTKQLERDHRSLPDGVVPVTAVNAGPDDGYGLFQFLGDGKPAATQALSDEQNVVSLRGRVAMVIGALAVLMFSWLMFRTPVEHRWTRGPRRWCRGGTGTGTGYGARYVRLREAHDKPLLTHQSLVTLFQIWLAVSISAAIWLYGSYIDDISRNDLAILLLASWLTASIALLRTPERDWRLLLFWLLMSGILFIGSLSLELLAQGAQDTHWLIYDLKHCRSLSTVFLFVVLLASIHIETLRDMIWVLSHPKTRCQRGLRWLLLLALVTVFGFWLAFGREEGLGSFQPVELGKFAAVLIAAIAIAGFDLNRRFASFRVQFGRFLFGLLLFLGAYVILFAVVPAAKSDYSPILILSVLGVVFAVVVAFWLMAHRVNRRLIHAQRWSIAPGRRPLRPRWLPVMSWRRPPWLPGMELIVILLTVSIALGLGWKVWGMMKDVRADRDTTAVVSFNTPEQRVAVYWGVQDFPDLGSQLLGSYRLIAATPCYAWEKAWWDRGDDLIEGLASSLPTMPCYRVRVTQPDWGFYSTDLLKPDHLVRGSGPASTAHADDPVMVLNPPKVMALAAVQDDFVMAFVFNRFGGLAALTLALLQLLVLWLMIDTALVKYVWNLGDYADDAVRQTVVFATLGGAGLLFLHWAISWGNVLGLLPIMGQPMTWVSSANSHLLFMAMPILLFTLIALRLPVRRRLYTQSERGPREEVKLAKEYLKDGWMRFRGHRHEHE